MRKVIDTSGYTWEVTDILKELLNVQTLPKFIIIETIEGSEQ